MRQESLGRLRGQRPHQGEREKGTIHEQMSNADEAARQIVPLLEATLLHARAWQRPAGRPEPHPGGGGGDEGPAPPLDVCVAETQGAMGYLLEKALSNELQRHGDRAGPHVRPHAGRGGRGGPGLQEPHEAHRPLLYRLPRQSISWRWSAGPWWRTAGAATGKVVASPSPRDPLRGCAESPLRDGLDHRRGRRRRHSRGAGSRRNAPRVWRPSSTRTGRRSFSRASWTWTTCSSSPLSQPLSSISASRASRRSLKRAWMRSSPITKEGQFPPGSMGPKDRSRRGLFLRRRAAASSSLTPSTSKTPWRARRARASSTRRSKPPRSSGSARKVSTSRRTGESGDTDNKE